MTNEHNSTTVYTSFFYIRLKFPNKQTLCPLIAYSHLEHEARGMTSARWGGRDFPLQWRRGTLLLYEKP